jgi:Schlafen group 3, DNA/RNA helicase domain
MPNAWYSGTREEFLSATKESIANQLAGCAVDEGLDTEPAQGEEWRRSVEILQHSLNERIPILRQALMAPACESINYVILEFDFRRRGLRMDCILLAEGVLFVVEFKRSKLDRAARDQVMSYGVNLIEFHFVTRKWCESDRAIVVPVLARTDGNTGTTMTWPGLSTNSWSSLVRKPIECDHNTLGECLSIGLKNRRSDVPVSLTAWLDSPFQPSSSILDATLSLYGNHDVVAIQQHAAPKAAIDASTREIRQHIDKALAESNYHIVFLSGAPGAGKTLVGLDIVMRGEHAKDSVFVTGNAPLVEVLKKALEDSYRSLGRGKASWTPTGYARSDANLVASAASFKIVKAHNFLGKRSQAHRQEDGRVLVFDEAQRTYEKGRSVLREKLIDNEADLILIAQRNAYPTGGAVVVALVGHNQAINSGERGIVAWLEAADRLGWTYSIADETLGSPEIHERERWAKHPSRKPLVNGYLHQSMRFYRNATVETWVAALLDGNTTTAQSLATILDSNSNTIWFTRNLNTARSWIRSCTIAGERCGIIASGQARRLAAEGLLVDFKPDIATWMLAPSTDIRSSSSLETVQNQYQIQGLELDYCIACWDADLRREDKNWKAYKLSGSDWQKDRLPEVAKNGYRVVLTRARKGMVIFIPAGDVSGEDPTRNVKFYDGIAEFIAACGARTLDAGTSYFGKPGSS